MQIRKKEHHRFSIRLFLWQILFVFFTFYCFFYSYLNVRVSDPTAFWAWEGNYQSLTKSILILTEYIYLLIFLYLHSLSLSLSLSLHLFLFSSSHFYVVAHILYFANSIVDYPAFPFLVWRQLSLRICWDVFPLIILASRYLRFPRFGSWEIVQRWGYWPYKKNHFFFEKLTNFDEIFRFRNFRWFYNFYSFSISKICKLEYL